MQVLITGGSGLIGRRLAAELAAGGHEVAVLSRRPDRVKDLPDGVRAEGWDGRTTHGWGPLVGGETAIVNLAGENLASGRWTAARKKRLEESRLDATRAVAEAVLKAKSRPRVVVQGSAVGYYGPCGDAEVTESSPAGDDFLARLCARWEAASDPIAEAGVRRAVARTGVVLDADGGALPKMALPFRFFAGGPLGSGDQWLPWIHAGDQTAALRFLIGEESAFGVFNLTAPEPATNEEVSRLLGEVLGRPSLLRTPAFALRAAVGEMAEALLTGQRARPKRLLDAGFEFRFPTAKAALEDLLG